MGKNIFPYIILIAASIFSSCSNEDEIIEPEVDYEYGITVSIASTGNKNGAEESTTRAIDGTGGFTAMYDAPYVYMHSVEAPSKYVKLPIIECDECASTAGPGEPGKGFQYTFCTNKDGSYTIKSTDGSSSATFGGNEEIYFSSEESETWEGTSVDASPITGQSVLVRDSVKNKEIYRSEENYTMQDVFNLGLNGNLLMKRKCSAFRVYFLFTELDEPLPGPPSSQTYWVDPATFEEKVGQSPYSFSGKLYIGPYFCDTYNINTGDVGYKNGHANGYYATNNQEYVPFWDIAYGRTEGEVPQNFNGYGVSTAGADYLITPYDENSTLDFTFYAFIKNTTDNPESDVNSKYITYHWEGVPKFNTTQVIIIMYNYKELAKAFNNPAASSLTRGFWKGPEKLDIKPAKVLYFEE